MSFELHSEAGFLGPVGSVEGWSNALDVLKSSSLPVVQDFLDQGYTSQPARLASAITELMGKAPLESDDRHTLTNLTHLLAQAKEIAIVSG